MARKWWTLIAVSVATFMLLLDITVVNTALPSIQKDLSANFTDLQWVIDAYTLALAAVVLTAGSLADRLGRRGVFAAGLGIFAVASLAAGLAPDATFLNISRAVQGIGAAAMFSVSLALVAQEFPAGRERAMAMGVYGATIGVAVAVGPLVGGAITDGLGWRAFTGVQLAAFAVSASLFALFLYLTLYLQNYLGYSPLQAGLRYLPITLAPFFVAPLAVALLARVNARVVMAIGLGGTGAGLLLMAGLSASSSWTALLPGFVVAGIGVGLLNPVIADVAVSVVSKERSGMASGINDTFRQVGVAVGVAAWGAIFLGRGADKISTLAAGTPAAHGDHPRQLIEAASSGGLGSALAGLPRGTRGVVANAAREGFLSGLNTILVAGAVLAFAGAALALWLVREHEIERDQLVPAGEALEASAG